MCSWGLSLFVLFELENAKGKLASGSWGLSLFVLFELTWQIVKQKRSSWGLSLFVLFELPEEDNPYSQVLED